ncbi:glutathione S-transferase [Mycena maculata]|uniref:glutathione transferase n=1 Tax=Mycena maculata TaxID=230809 RepID=A0AAD7K5N1_9AGAR|nr:glutathione S-transferase [Mycena maculata]
MVDADSNTPKITLHWLDRSRSQRILWLLEEANVSYEIKRYKRDEKMLAPPELKAVHGLGHAPVLTIGDRPIAESAVIAEYVSDHFAPQLIPQKWKDGCEGKLDGETESWMRYRYYMHYCEGSLMAMMMLALIPMAMKRAPTPFFLRPIVSRIAAQLHAAFVVPGFATHLAFLEAELASAPDGGPYLCGVHLTGADILMSYPLLVARLSLDGPGPLNKEKYPKLWQYTELLETTPSYKRAVGRIVELEGKYELL